MESQAPSSVGDSGAICETTLSGFFLIAVDEEAEFNSFESRTAGVLVNGVDSGAERSVVPAGEIPGYQLTSERTYFKLRNRVWELEIKNIMKAQTEEILTNMQGQDVEELCPFEEQVFWP